MTHTTYSWGIFTPSWICSLAVGLLFGSILISFLVAGVMRSSKPFTLKAVAFLEKLLQMLRRQP